MDLSIIIVNWNSRDFLRKCLVSIRSRTRGLEYEILVIDNASGDGCGEMIRAEFPGVRFMQSGKNLGFARANNRAFPDTAGRNILFLNPDTEIEDDALARMSRLLDAAPEAGIVGARLLNSDRTIQTSATRAFPTILNQLLDTNALRRLFPAAVLWGTRPLFAPGSAPAQVDAVSGACLMIKREVFEQVGMFSSEYFMYSEDIDLCFKVRQAGRKITYLPAAAVVHHGGTSSSLIQSSFSSIMMLESRWRFFHKTRPPWYASVYRMEMLLVSIIRIALMAAAWPVYGLRGRGQASAQVMKKWIGRLRWTIGAERWVKDY